MPTAPASELPSRELNTSSQIVALRKLLADREALIDNLIARAGVLESSMVDKQEYADSLASEFEAQGKHIEKLSEAIEHRDRYIANLENKHFQSAATTAVVEGGQPHLMDSDQKTKEKLAHLEELNHSLHLKIDELHHQSSTFLPELTHSQASLAAKIERTSGLLADSSLNNSSELKNITSALQQLLAEELRGSIEFLTNKNSLLLTELGFRDQWGVQAQQRLSDLAHELASIKNSSSWKITAPLRILTTGFKSFVRNAVKLVLIPYRGIAWIAWRVAPKLMHKIYHSDQFKRFVRAKNTQNLAEKSVKAEPTYSANSFEEKSAHPGAQKATKQENGSLENKGSINRLDKANFS